MLKKENGRVLHFAGLVNTANQRVTKKGTRFGSYIIEDYESSIEITLWSEDYSKFGPLLEKGNIVYVSGHYRQRYENADYQFQVQEIILLESLMKKHTKSVEVKMVAKAISAEAVNFLENNIHQNPGPARIKVSIFDPKSNNVVNLVRNGGGITMNSDLADFISGRSEMELLIEMN